MVKTQTVLWTEAAWALNAEESDLAKLAFCYSPLLLLYFNWQEAGYSSHSENEISKISEGAGLNFKKLIFRRIDRCCVHIK